MSTFFEVRVLGPSFSFPTAKFLGSRLKKTNELAPRRGLGQKAYLLPRQRLPRHHISVRVQHAPSISPSCFPSPTSSLPPRPASPPQPVARRGLPRRRARRRRRFCVSSRKGQAFRIPGGPRRKKLILDDPDQADPENAGAVAVSPGLPRAHPRLLLLQLGHLRAPAFQRSVICPRAPLPPPSGAVAFVPPVLPATRPAARSSTPTTSTPKIRPQRRSGLDPAPRHPHPSTPPLARAPTSRPVRRRGWLLRPLRCSRLPGPPPRDRRPRQHRPR